MKPIHHQIHLFMEKNLYYFMSVYQRAQALYEVEINVVFYWNSVFICTHGELYEKCDTFLDSSIYSEYPDEPRPVFIPWFQLIK